MRLPKVLAVAVGSVLAAGSASAVTLSLREPAASHLADGTGPDLVSGVGRHPATAAATSAGSGRGGSQSSPTPSTGAASGGSGPSGPAGRSGRPGRFGLAVPASGVPLSGGLDPASPAPSSFGPAGGPIVVLPTPSAGHLPAVSPLAKVRSADAVVMLPNPLTPDELAALPKLKGVQAVDRVDTGTVQLGGAPVVAFGVDPNSFRVFTPPASAGSDQLWQYLAGGSLVSSYDMADDRSLQLGATQVLDPPSAGATPGEVQAWMGAFASIGLPGVDLLVSHAYSSALHLTPDSGLVVSAPGVDGATLQSELQAALPGAAVELLHANQVPQTIPGDTLGTSSRQAIVTAALSRQGLPYVWGAVGPDSFDCSGLVQWAYRQAGILMPRVAAEQFLTGDHIPLADAQPGDLLFWTYDPSDPGYVDHVAIYLGNGLMIAAPHTGTVVQVSSVPTDEFAGAVSVVLRHS